MLTTDDVRSLLGRLQKARQELKTEGLIDPATAIVVSPLTVEEAGNQIVVGDQHHRPCGRADGAVRQATPEQIHLLLRPRLSIVSISAPWHCRLP
jgi:hypothetical protein